VRRIVRALAPPSAGPSTGASPKSCADDPGSGTLGAMAGKVEAGKLSVVEHAALTDVGRERDHNEDSLFSDDPVFAVADGMGGAQAGEVASGMAIEAVEQAKRAGDLPERTVPVIEEANAKIHAAAREDSSRAGMGCTLTMAVVEGREVVIGHVGDSRGYRVREGHLEQLTEDHSLVAGLIKLGKLTPEEAKTHPQRSVILRALGPASAVEVDVLHIEPREDDIYLLCSDGLTGMVKDEVIEETLVSMPALDEALETLIECANAAGGLDNITAVAFRLGRAV
jgi:serine/threonine protein phosphatase PrpC